MPSLHIQEAEAKKGEMTYRWITGLVRGQGKLEPRTGALWAPCNSSHQVLKAAVGCHPVDSYSDQLLNSERQSQLRFPQIPFSPHSLGPETTLYQVKDHKLLISASPHAYFHAPFCPTSSFPPHFPSIFCKQLL